MQLQLHTKTIGICCILLRADAYVWPLKALIEELCQASQHLVAVRAYMSFVQRNGIVKVHIYSDHVHSNDHGNSRLAIFMMYELGLPSL